MSINPESMGVLIEKMRNSITESNSNHQKRVHYVNRRKSLAITIANSTEIQEFLDASKNVLSLIDMQSVVSVVAHKRNTFEALGAVANIMAVRDLYINGYDELVDAIGVLSNKQVSVLTKQFYVGEDEDHTGIFAVDCSSLPIEIVDWLRVGYFVSKLDDILLALQNKVLAGLAV